MLVINQRLSALADKIETALNDDNVSTLIPIIPDAGSCCFMCKRSIKDVPTMYFQHVGPPIHKDERAFADTIVSQFGYGARIVDNPDMEHHLTLVVTACHVHRKYLDVLVYHTAKTGVINFTELADNRAFIL